MGLLRSQSPLTQAEISEVRQEVGGCLYMACGPCVRQQRIDEDQHGDAGQDQQNTADAFRLEEIADGVVQADYTAEAHSPKTGAKGFVMVKSFPLHSDKEIDDQRIHQVNEKAGDQWHDDKGTVGRTILLGDCCHIDDGGRC